MLVGVAIAFADSSIVVLAVPDVIGELDVGVSAASWVITAYNLAVVVGGLALLPFLRRLPPRALAAGGLALFAIASVGCAAAPSFAALVGFRALQGLAAAAVLVGVLSLLGGSGGTRAWALAATVGVAAGPALGGLLTELFTWRAIFIAQAPAVTLGLLAVAGRRFASDVLRARPADRRTVFANVALSALSAALVGALFLVVVLLINGFGWRPLPAALVATTLPIVAVAGERVGRHLAVAVAASAGSLLVAVGLVTLGFLPGPEIGLVVAGLALCGAGLGLASQPLGARALSTSRLASAGAHTVVARHAGLVVALVVVTPLLVSSLTALERKGEAVGGDLVLEAPLPLSTKLPVMLELARAADRAETGLPDVDATLASAGADHDGAVARLAEDLTTSLHDLVARAFRSSFLLCALFALVAAVASAGARDRVTRGPTRRGTATLAALFVAAGVALTADFRLGALEDPAAAADPCRSEVRFQHDGVDATVQRVTLLALAGTACDLDTSRAELLRSLVASGPSPWPQQELEGALRTGIDQAITTERQRGTIDATTATLLRVTAAGAPLAWIREVLSALA